MEMILNNPYKDIFIAIVIFIFFIIIRTLFTKYILKILDMFVKNTTTNIDDKLLQVTVEPLKLFIVLLGLSWSFYYANISNTSLLYLLKSLYIFNIFWFFYEFIVVFRSDFTNFAKRFGNDLHEEISAFIIKALKILIVFIGIASILQIWNINISAFVASLGIGGLAFALAAKDTAANLFGGLTLLADKSLKINDWVKINSVEGIVENIGLRTTKIRTFEKSLITVPNQILANTPIENFSKRGIRRIKFRVGLTYDTTSQTIQNIVNSIENMLKTHKDISQDATMLVRFDKFEDSSLSIFVYTFTNTSNWAKYLEIKEDINLQIIKIIENHKSDFAYPSQTLYIKKDDNV
jgi:MscS family membrane protein